MLRRTNTAALLLFALCAAPLAVAQQPGGGAVAINTAAAQPAAAGPKNPHNPPRRVFAEGVLTNIPSDLRSEETFTGPEPILEILKGAQGLDWTPETLPETRTLKAMAEQVIYRRNVWGLDFSFKPIRMIEVDVPQPTGKMQRKTLWYMVFRVRNMGNPLEATATTFETGDTLYEAVQASGSTAPIRFFPRFVLESSDQKKEYLDRLVPVAMEPIAAREMGGTPLYDTVSVSRFDMPVSSEEVDNGVWGVAIWEDIDPNTDYFSIYVDGLTNAYRWTDKPENVDPMKIGAHREYQTKTLKLNFWRPGDRYNEHEDEIRFGVQGQVDYEWVYR
ncbi:hypothetical protein M4951_23755 [Blastopirellula sp. J2-11]|uniref:hypothetical protein n=1 Tax=Blastopirellula sp. J2-11 TaxID=2943192 RepID=UPI0021C65465|nr:hypothetical protein [Blastopirellula sp. J2-11]UUO06350.1 hypothetical protein M4951_23755 [Blastopirellula sp. J2-11]